VSIARWNLKGMRRSTGPQSMGKPKMNRSAKGGEGRVCETGTKALLIRLTKPRCLRAARYRRTARDLRRADRVSGWHRSKRTYKQKRSGERRPVSSRTAAYY